MLLPLQRGICSFIITTWRSGNIWKDLPWPQTSGSCDPAHGSVQSKSVVSELYGNTGQERTYPEQVVTTWREVRNWVSARETGSEDAEKELCVHATRSLSDEPAATTTTATTTTTTTTTTKIKTKTYTTTTTTKRTPKMTAKTVETAATTQATEAEIKKETNKTCKHQANEEEGRLKDMVHRHNIDREG